MGIGIIIISLRNKCFVLLEDALFISNLNYIFILARKFAIFRYISSFNKKRIIFIWESNYNNLIKAKFKSGLYIILNISKFANSIIFDNILYKELLLYIILISNIIYFSLIIENVFNALNDKGSSLLENNNSIEVEYIFIHINNLS